MANIGNTVWSTNNIPNTVAGFMVDDESGNDTISAAGQSSPVTIDLGNSARVAVYNDATPFGYHQGYMYLSSGTVIENAIGGTGVDWLYGNSLANVLDGGAGADAMEGRGGDDTYIVDNSGDIVTEAASEGIDTVVAKIDGYTLPANVENLTLDAGVVSGNGNSLSNYMLGNAGNNTLDGGAGADKMEGGAGDDYYYVDDANDIVLEAAGGGNDLIYTSSTFTVLPGNVEKLTMQVAGTGVGNAGANTIIGTAGADILDGKEGNDQLQGWGGADVFRFAAGSGYDTITDFSRAQGDKIGLPSGPTYYVMNFNSLTGVSTFHHIAGELHFYNYTLTGDLDGDGSSDFTVGFVGTASLAASDITTY